MVVAPSLPENEVQGAAAEPAEHLNAICTSEAFRNSATQKNLLRYLFENRDKQLSEYLLAVEALGRREDFDPQVDATVRVQISRLRRKLKDFYLAEGRSAAMRFCIPLGTHQLVLDDLRSTADISAGMPGWIESAQTQRPGAEPHARNRMLWSAPVVSLACVSMLLLGVCMWQMMEIKAQRAELALQHPPATMLPLWQEFTVNGKPTHIVIPNPTFFTWQSRDGRTLLGRDTAVNSFMDLETAPELRMLNEKFGKPTLGQFYAVSSDVVASLKLSHYLDSGRLSNDLAISSDTPWDTYENDNIILVGTPGTLTSFKAQLDRLYFRIDPQAFRIENPHPQASEAATYSSIIESDARVFRPGLIAMLPGITKDSRIMILAGQSTSALVSFLTSQDGSAQLQSVRQRAGKGAYFEAVIMSEMTGNTVLRNRLAAIRTYPASGARP